MIVEKPVIGVMAETRPGERRVALVPADVKRLAPKMKIVVERGAGVSAQFLDGEYEAAGATLADGVTALQAEAGVLVKVRAPTDAEIEALKPGVLLLSTTGRDAALEAKTREKGALHLVLERVPRITRAQSMDVLSSQATIAGYAAVLLGASQLGSLLPMITTAAGTIRPAKALVVGAGVAGLQAIATLRRLGAVTFGFDIRRAAGEQVESLGATFIPPEGLEDSETAGGYARAQTEEEARRAIQTLAKRLPEMALVITTALVPGRPAPRLIETVGVDGMAPGAVMVDLAAETGGNIALTKADEVVRHKGVTILGPTNLPSAHASDASRLYSGNIRTLLDHLAKDGNLVLDDGDEIVVALLGAKPSELAPASA